MRRLAASFWALIVLVAVGFLVLQLWQGIDLRSDLTALIPQEDHAHYNVQANDRVSKHFSKKIILALGHKDKGRVYDAAHKVRKTLNDSHLFESDNAGLSFEKMKELGALYYPHRHALLSNTNRKLLQENKGDEIAQKAIAQAYSVVGHVTARKLREDPFNLSMDYMTSLPVAESQFSFYDGFLTAEQGGKVWVLITGNLRGEPYALDIQDKVSAALEQALRVYADVSFYKTGAVFYAQAGARQALSETTLIGSAALLSTIILLVLAFRSLYPLALSILVIGVGFAMALSFSIWFWDDLHVCALLFGISLIGVTVDYSLEYCAQIFSDNGLDPVARLKNVFSGLSLGAATTIIGYVTMLIAPFPGLRQIALFSVVGSSAAWLCVVFWFPYLDKRTKRPAQSLSLKVIVRFSDFWDKDQFKVWRYTIFISLFVLVCFGALRFHSDDDVRKLQTLSSDLKEEEAAIKSLTGSDFSNRFIVVSGLSEEAALQKEEAVVEQLQLLIRSGSLKSYQALSSFVPSLKRQKENISLVEEKLFIKHGSVLSDALGFSIDVSNISLPQIFLLPALYQEKEGALSFLSFLYKKPQDNRSMHLIMLEGLTKPEVVAAVLKDIKGVHFVDVVSDYTKLFGKYRYRALMLLAAATFLMLLLLAWRYGLQKGSAVLAPPVMAVVITPFICAVFGNAFTFFDAIALLLVLSMGLDYSIFYKETTERRRHVTLLAIFLSACTTMMSFGFLSFSTVMAVSNFGTTMLVGVILSFLFAPFVRSTWPKFKRFSGVSAVLLLLSLSACGTYHEAIKKTPILIAPDLAVTLPAHTFFYKDTDVLQSVVVSYGDQTFSFQSRTQISKDGFKLVCFDSFGQRIFSASWTENGIQYKTASWMPSTLRAENVLIDLFLIYWPETIVKESLSGNGTLVISNNQRRILQNGEELSKTTYKDTKKIWQTAIHHENSAWGYTLDIESQRIEP